MTANLDTHSDLSWGLWNRPKCFLPFIGDGDSSAYAMVDKSRPYSPAIFIQNDESVNNVRKQMGSNFSRLIKECTGKKLRDGKGVDGKWRLMNARIDTIQFLYGCTICDNIEDAPKMSAKVKAILDHKVVPKKNHITIKVSYQRDKSSCNIDLCSTEKYFVKVVMFIFNHLDNQGFLEGCKNTSKQNAN